MFKIPDIPDIKTLKRFLHSAAKRRRAGRMLQIVGIAAYFIAVFMPLISFKYDQAGWISMMEYLEKTPVCFYLYFGALIFLLAGFECADRRVTIAGALISGFSILLLILSKAYRYPGNEADFEIGFYMYLTGCLMILAGGLLTPSKGK